MKISYTSVKYKLYYFRGEHIDKQYFLYTKRIHYTQIGFLILIFSNPNKNACYCGFDENSFAVACSNSPVVSNFNKVF